ncbi:MAG: hypothetical protein QXT13_10855 [Pyrobaculum sp.]
MNLLLVFVTLAVGAFVIAVVYAAWSYAAEQASRVYAVPSEAGQVWDSVISQYSAVILIIAIAAVALYIYSMTRTTGEEL